MSRARRVEVFPLGLAPLPPGLLQHLRDGIAAELRLDVRISPALALPAAEGNRTAALSAARLIDALIVAAPDANERRVWRLGVTGVDLTAPERDFVFGAGTRGGAWALLGVARLGPPGVPTPRLLERALKEALHELGHLAGLDHCPTPRCVMGRAGTRAELDHKKSKFCQLCKAGLGPPGCP